MRKEFLRRDRGEQPAEIADVVGAGLQERDRRDVGANGACEAVAERGHGLGCQSDMQAELAAFGEDRLHRLGVEPLSLVDDEQMRPPLGGGPALSADGVDGEAADKHRAEERGIVATDPGEIDDQDIAGVHDHPRRDR